MRFLQGESSNPPSTSKGISALPLFLVTCSKDTFVKLWDLTTQHCVQTIVAHRSEVWTLDVDPSEDILLTGSGEGEVKAWKINQAGLKSGLQESSSGEVCLFVSIPIHTETQYLYQLTKMIHPLTVLPVSSRQRISQIHYHPTAPFLAIQSHDRSIDVFRIRTEDEVRKKRARRQKRIKEKKSQKGTVADEDIFGNEDAEIQLVDLYTPYLVVRASGKIRSFNFVVNDLQAKATQVSSYPTHFGKFIIYTSFSLRFQVTPSKSIQYHYHKKAKRYLKPRERIPWICLDIELIYALWH
jgi:U3 small nucleolar RNA-associated protein 12